MKAKAKVMMRATWMTTAMAIAMVAVMVMLVTLMIVTGEIYRETDREWWLCW